MKKMQMIIGMLMMVGMTTSQVGCGSGSGSNATPDDPSKADSAKADQWVQVTQCQGWDLCLDSLVAAKDLQGEPDDSFGFPMRQDIGVVSSVQNLEISPNCKDTFAIDGDNNLVCLPYGEETAAFVVGKFIRQSTTEDGYLFLVFDYAKPARATLLKNTNAETIKYYLTIQ